jgi:arabinogalactan endo-1,4-beta-galactosidase
MKMFRRGFRSFLPVFLFLAMTVGFIWGLNPVTVQAAAFANGADVSWLPQMEAQGYKFYDDSGVQKDCLQILKEHGIDSIRLRVWVNPSNDLYSGHCSKSEMVSMAVRAKNMGFRIMIDFHYSDSWADPGKQNKPAAWSGHGITQLKTDVYNHTTDVLNALKSSGVTPEWVQVGNETNDGMLWEDGRASKSMSNFTQLINSGYDAVKAVFSSAKVIVHISNGYDNSLFRWIFDGLKNNGGKYDVIAMSLYPSSSNWSSLNSQCLANMNDMVSRYGKEIIISEVGMEYTDASACKSFLTDIINKTKSVSGGKGTGVFYWEPQCYNWAGYTKGAWNTNGRPTVALDAFGGSVGPTPTPVRTATPTRTATSTPVRTVTPTPIRTVTPNVTPVRTPTPNGTPVRTATPIPPTGSIKVQFYNQSTAATTNQLYLNINLVNTGSAAITLANVKIRYYYTIDGAKPQNFYCDWAQAGSANVTGTFVTLSAAKTGADTYVEIGFLSGGGNLAGGAGTPIQARIAKNDWTNYTQTNDYSFNASATNYVDWTKVTGYISGSIQWGTEP